MARAGKSYAGTLRTKGAKKAYSAIRKTYGKAQGNRIFFAKMNKQTGGSTGRSGATARASKFYKTGGSQRMRRPRK